MFYIIVRLLRAPHFINRTLSLFLSVHNELIILIEKMTEANFKSALAFIKSGASVPGAKPLTTSDQL